MKRGNLICLGVLVVLVCMQGFGAAAVRMVPSVYPTIQDAIDAANPNDIVLVLNGTYKGVGNYELDFRGKRLLVRSWGGPENCTIDCDGLGRGFFFHSGEDALSTVWGFTITNGVAVDFGGAVECYNASPRIENCIIRGNYAADGGAIDCWGGSPTIVGCVITDNIASYFGGGIECYESAATIENCLIRGNSAGELGGGVDCYDSAAIITNCTIVENEDAPGSGTSGGIYAEGLAYPTITNCILWDNTGDLEGAGASATHSCIEDGDSGTGNTDENPEFRTGPLGDYYLSQTDANQLVDSPCVDKGDANANDPNVALDTYTTRIDSVGDACEVDMGYHYAKALVEYYQVISYVVAGANSQGRLDPNHPDASDPNSWYNEFSEIVFTADPCDGFKVKKWMLDGNDVLLDPNDASSFYTGEQFPDYPNEPPLIIDSNVEVSVEFEPSKPYQVTVKVVDGIGGTFEVDPNRGTFDPCTGEYSGTFYEADVLQVTAKPNDINYGIKWMIYYPDRTEPCYPVPDPCVLSVPVDSNMGITLEFLTECLTFSARVIGGNGRVEPRRDCNSYMETVNVNAYPDNGYRVKVWMIYYSDHNEVWFPTPGDPNHIVVTMTDNIHLTVSFEPGPIKIIKVPFEYATIQAAIDAAVDGYRIVVAPNPAQPYTVPAPDGIDFRGKKVILMSEDPNDPDVVAATIIDCGGSSLNPSRALHFHSGEDANTIVMGFTIQNGYYVSPIGQFGRYGVMPPIPYEPIDPADGNTAPRAERGRDSPHGDNYGGAILCDGANVEPIIKNCVITNCVIAGGRGGDGAFGVDGPWVYQLPDPNDPTVVDPNSAPQETPDGQWGGHGGDGYGDGHGGAIACINGSSPTIIGCIIKDNIARGGVGGDGGWGGWAEEDPPGLWPPSFVGMESGSGSGGDGIGDGFGGGIYCDHLSTAIVRDCAFSNNTATQGLGGIAGMRGWGNPYTVPPDMSNLPPAPLDGIAGSSLPSFWPAGLIAGGAAYYDAFSNPNFMNCQFVNNMAGLTVTGPMVVPVFTRGGGLYSGPLNNVDLNDCNFVGNVGGAVYCEPTCVLSVERCLFRNNNITDGGGAIYAAHGGLVKVRDSSFTANAASGDGGALNSESDARLTKCTFTGNIASGHGGAVYGYDSLGPGGRLSFDVNSCKFGGNRAVSGWGGGVYSKNFDAVFTDCSFAGNMARSGGGLFLAEGSVTFADGMIYGNRAIGGDGSDMGGGLVCSGTKATIENCIIRGNVSDGPYGSGGGISLYAGGEAVTHLVKNCLLTDNSATMEGGAISCYIYTAPGIQNCTFSNDSTGGLGGAVFCDWLSSAVITDSIFADCNGYAIVQQDFDDAIITYSMFHNNLEGDYGVYDSSTGQIETFAGSALDATNINADPVFAGGPLGGFYLDQSASQAVNTGSKRADALGMNVLTTDPNGQLDSGIVDRGYHYDDVLAARLFQLTVAVIGDHGGTMEPTGPEPVAYDPVSDIYTYHAGTMVMLTAEPDISYRLRRWSGTSDDTSRKLTNVVVMDSDRDVTVEFGQPRTLVVGSDPNYTTIQHTIDNANDGDTVIIPSGRYTPAYLDGGVIPPIMIIGKGITLTSENPDDGNCVAATVLDTYVIWVLDYVPWYGLFGLFDPSAAYAHPPTDTRTIIDGITITNPNVWGDGGVVWVQNRSPIIRNCVFTDCHFYGPWGMDLDPCWYPIDGPPGVSVYGGAIAIYGGSPDIQNCVFTNCSATGGTGGRGSDCSPYGSDGGWAGKAYGGAIYIDPNSEPTIIDCSFTNCFVQGGDGGDGGDGDWHGGRGGNWEWAPSIETGPFTFPYWLWWDGWYWETFYGPYEDYWKYSGYGGAIYSASKSSAKIIRCTFADNHSYGGVCGIGGEPWPTPERNLNIENFGGTIFVTNGSTELIDCSISDSSADPNFDPRSIFGPNAPDDIFISYGGAIAVEDAAFPKFIDCNISNSEACIGGGIYWSNSTATITDCNITDSTAYHGGGLYSVDSNGTITGSTIARNEASHAPIYLPDDPNLYYDPSEILGRGGGYYCFSSAVEITDSVFSENRATTSGGGIYFSGSDQDSYFRPVLHNCLVANNSAGRDGGGISCNWYADLRISNSTIADNRLMQSGGYGGGLYCSYETNVEVIDSIIWVNRGMNGAQVAVAMSIDYGARPSTLYITNSDIGPSYDPNEAIDFGSVEPFPGGQAGPGAVLVDEQTIYDRFRDGQERVKVIVSLVEPNEIREATDWDSAESVQVLRDEIASRQSSVLSSLCDDEFTLRHQYVNQAGFSGEVTVGGLNKLLADPLVAHIEPVRKLYPTLAQGIPLMNAAVFRSSYNGEGMAIAICDTGVDYTHPMLGGGGFPNNKVIGGYDFGDGDADPIHEGHPHGTSCAGLACGDFGVVGDYIGGVAYNAKIYALKISFGGTGSASTDSMVAAWDWCVTHKNDDPDHPIMVTSTSFGGGRFFSPEEADSMSPAMKAAADNAVVVGITVLASAGNNGFTDSLSWPAAISSVISLGAVYDADLGPLYFAICADDPALADHVTCYSNTADFLDILAPSNNAYTADIVGAGGYTAGDYTPDFGGTSAACPYAAGAVACLQSAAMDKLGSYLTPGEVRYLLAATGDPVTDTKVDITKPRVNLAAAIGGIAYGPPIYVEAGCTLNDREPNDPNFWIYDITIWDPDANNIPDDPLFTHGYYLSHIAARQDADSNCIDAGSDLAKNVGLNTYTTRTDGVPDDNDPNDPNDKPNSAIVDMGYHYREGLNEYLLTVTVVDDANNPIEPNQAHGYVVPSSGIFYDGDVVSLAAHLNDGYRVRRWTGTDDDLSTDPNNTVTMTEDKQVGVEFELIPMYRLTVTPLGHGSVDPNGELLREEGEVVELTAEPDPNYRVKRWTGTDDDLSYALTNTVTMTEDKDVTVEFEERATIEVPGDANYLSIQAAVNDARDGDIIVVSRGRYRGGGIYIDKAITLTSANPDDPCIVAETIIDCEGYPHRGIYISGDCGPNTVINGLTIANCSWYVIPSLGGWAAGYDGFPGGDTVGGAIYIERGASPTILNCIITNVQIRAGDGGDGADGGEDPNDPDEWPPWLPGDQHGGNGGNGGTAYGGGIYCGEYSGPTILNCRISNCQITGGDAGNGGNGVSPEDEDSMPSPAGGDGGYGGRAGGAYGGGIYVAGGSTPTIEDCVMVNCSATAGNAGDGGDGGDEGDDWWGGGFGGNGGENNEADGGGIYCANDVEAGIFNCRVMSCSTIAGNAGDGGDGGSPWGPGGYGGGYFGEYWKDGAHGGGVYCGSDSNIIIENCTFNDSNVTGGMSGIGGLHDWGIRNYPKYSYVISSYGAGVFCKANSLPRLLECEITGNRATEVYPTLEPNDSNDPNDPNYVDPSEPAYRLSPYISYGGGVCYLGPGSMTITDCNLSDNYATVGGGLYWDEANSVVTDCNIANNSAFTGGGIHCTDNPASTIRGCKITGNRAGEAGGDAGGQGGGIHCFSVPAVIADCQITYNQADVSGGGVYLSGSAPDSTILKNCLIADNRAGRDGAGISCNWYIEAAISNCTIADNRLRQIPAYGGGLYCSYKSIVEVIDSIIWGNLGSDGSQVAVGSGDPGLLLSSTVTITYSDIQVFQEEPNEIGTVIVDPDLIGPNTPDYFIYGEFDTGLDGPSYGLYGWVGTDGIDRIIHYSPVLDPNYDPMDPSTWIYTTTAYIHTVTIPAGADPHAHPSNPYAPGDIATRTFTLERSFDPGDNFTAYGHASEFYVDPVENAIYIGAYLDGILKYTFDPSADNPVEGGPAGNYVYDTQIAPPSPATNTSWRTETLAYDPDNDIWYAGGKAWDESATSDNWEVFEYDGSQGPDGTWELVFAYHPLPPVPGTYNYHHDGMAFINGYLFLANMYGDNIMQFIPDGTLVNIFSHEPLPRELESMGFGALEHFWVGSFNSLITEFGGGAIQAGITALPPRPPIYVEEYCTLVGWDPNDPNDFLSWDVNSWHEDTNNIDKDPLFVAGYYLSWWDAAQDANSPCVDRGSDFASNLGLHTYTTRTDGINDQNEVDLGYHYSHGITQYRLTLSVVDANGDAIVDPNLIYGAVAPNEPRAVDYNLITNTYTFYIDTQVSLIADPCDGYRVKTWTGTDDDLSTDANNTVTMTEDKLVTVEFELIPVYQLHLSVVHGHGTVEVSDAEPLSSIPSLGIYTFYDETVVTLTAKPDLNYRVERWIGTDDDSSTGLNNTVTMDDHKEVTVEFELPQTIEVSVLDEPNAIQDAVDRARSRDTLIVGAGTYTTDGINLRGKDIVVTSTNPDDPDVVAATIIECGPGGRAFIFNSGEDANTVVRGFTIVDANVTGENGGAIYVGSNSSPKIVSLVISNCSAVPDPNTGAGGYGGGIYVTDDSEPNFVNCTITDCNAEGGGGAYCDSNSSPTFWHCTFSENSADFGGGMLCNSARLITVRDCNFANNSAPSGAGLYGEPNSIVAVEGSVFVGNVAANQGGAMYWEAATMSITDSNIVDNAAQYGGGLYCIYSPETEIIRCTISYNRSPNDVLDPNDANDPNALLVGQGAGIYCFATPALIRDCVITRNTANTSGGGVYLIGESNSPQVINCLIIYNLAGRDGGGISVNWLADPLIANCTIVGNAAPGIFGENGDTGLGGGFYCAYYSESEIIDSILWNNFAQKGWEIAVGIGFEPDPIPSTLTVTYSDVKGGRSAAYVENLCELWGWYPGDPCYPSNIDSDPLFVTGPLDDYYLSQTDAGQLQDSLCVDAGSDLATNLDMTTDRNMNRYTTRTDQVLDRGTVDMGYHYTATGEPCRFCDFVYDGIINFRDFAVLALRWRNEACSDVNDWCSGADLTLDTYVDFEDLAVLAKCWLVIDDEAPEPDPTKWEVEPYPTSTVPPCAISMTVETAIDAWGWDVEYYFFCITDGAFNSPGWQSSPTYEATGLTQGAQYCFKAKARDGVGNETGWSDPSCAIACGGPDTTPPAPPPEIIFMEPNSPNSITMTASTAYDASLPVQYYFECTFGGGHDSGWLNEPNYTDIGLATETQYCYRVKARDSASPVVNETGWSDPVCEFTLPPEDITVPDPNPAEWDMTVDANGHTGEPRQVYVGPTDFDWWAEMRAEPATDASGVEYKFVCTDSTFSSGGSQDQLYGDGVEWRNETNVLGDPRVYRVKVGGSYVDVSFYVIVRDRSPNHNTTLPSETLSWR